MNYINDAHLLCTCCHTGHPSTTLISALNAIQNAINQPLTIHSGCRCPKHNAEVGGAPLSTHVTGMAADISCPALTPLELYLVADQQYAFRNGGIGLYPSQFIHLDVRPTHARWFRVNGRDHPITEYIHYARAI